MSSLERHRQEFEELADDIQSLGDTLNKNQGNEQIDEEIQLTHVRISTLREGLSNSQARLPDGSLVVESDHLAFGMLCRDSKHSNIGMWSVSKSARIQLVKFSSITESELGVLPLLSQLNGLGIKGIGSLSCLPIGDLPALTSLDMSGGRDTDLRFLERLSSLAALGLRDFNLKSVESIAGLKSLDTLSLPMNPIENLSTIEKFPNLKNLNLNYCRNEVDLAPLVGLPLLEQLSVRSNDSIMRISLDILREMPKLTYIWVSPGIGKFGNNQAVLNDLKARKVEVNIS